MDGAVPSESAGVAAYPAPPGAHRSSSHRVRVAGQPVFVERWRGVHYARFAMHGPQVVRIAVDEPIGAYQLFPARHVATAEVHGNELRLVLETPANLVVWIDRLEKLFLLPDPIDGAGLDLEAGDAIDVRALGADPTGRVASTDAIQSAIEEAASRPAGGTVLVPAGRFRTGTLTIRSHVALHLAAGSLLQGSADPRDYPLDAGRRESAGDESLAPDVRYLGRTMTFTRLLLVEGATDVRIVGRGTIDGNGTYLRTQALIAPNLLRVRESTGVEVAGVLFRDSAAWSLHLLASSQVACRNVKIVNDRTTLNTDGIDLDMSSDAVVDGSFIFTKDDAICVKATGHAELSGEPSRVRVTNNLVSSVDAALKVGTESDAERFRDIAFEGNHVFESGRAMSVVVRDGASYERVAFRRTGVGPGVGHLIEQVIGVRDPAAALGRIRDLTFDQVDAPTFVKPPSNWTWYAQFRPGRPGRDTPVNVFEGADDEHNVTDLHLGGIAVAGERLRDANALERAAGVTIGPHVREVTID